MRRVLSVAALASFACATAAQAQGSTITFGGGPVFRAAESGSLSGSHGAGIATQLGIARERVGARVSPQMLLGLHGFLGASGAIPSCVPGGDCRAERSLSFGAYATAGVSVRGFDVAPGLRWLAGGGAYWAGTANPSGRPEDGARSLVGLGANAGLAYQLDRRLEVEMRVHVPFGLDEVRWFASPMLSVRW